MSYYGNNGYISGDSRVLKRDEISGSALFHLREFISLNLGMACRRIKQVVDLKELQKLEKSCPSIIVDKNSNGSYYPNKWVIE